MKIETPLYEVKVRQTHQLSKENKCLHTWLTRGGENDFHSFT